jgi:hypothetical protein
MGALIKLGWVACDERQNEEGHKLWHNTYWKTELENNGSRLLLVRMRNDWHQ